MKTVVVIIKKASKFFGLRFILIMLLVNYLQNIYGQNVSISPTGNAPDNSAALDIRDYTDKGILIPRLTTAQRNAIPSPALSLLIFNITTMCYEWWNGTTWIQMGCGNCTSAPSGVSAVATPNPVCQGQTLNLQGSGTNVTSWNWSGPNGFTSNLQNPSISNITASGSGIYTLTATNACGSTMVTTASVSVNSPPTIANAGPDQVVPCGVTTVTLTGNTPLVGTGTWSLISGSGTISNPNSPTTTVTGLGTGTNVFSWIISNPPCAPSTDNVNIIVGGSSGQFASSVINYSSQWSSTSWSAYQATGAPNTCGCGDIATAWASSSTDGQREFLVLGFSSPQVVSQINIYETYNPGAVDTVYLRNSSTNTWNMVWFGTASPATPCPRVFTINIPTTPYTVNAIRIAINSPAVPGWNEIDAVEIKP